MPIFSTAGSKLSIGAAIDEKNIDFVAADFTSQTWVEIKNLETLGSLGDTSEAINQAIIGESRVKTLKGARTASTMEIVAALDYADAGQLALIAAEKQSSAFAFKLELADKPAAGASPKNSIRYFIAKVMSIVEAYEGANSVVNLTATLGVNSNIVKVAASAT